MIARIIYALCAITSLACALLLLRGFSQSRVRLLLWGGLCFVCLFINNVLLYVDVEVLPMVDLTIARAIPVLVGLALLIYGLVWEAK
ncbi:MAG TPA: DUF5985 family protein [Gemmatimonadaceae bacterium]